MIGSEVMDVITPVSADTISTDFKFGQDNNEHPHSSVCLFQLHQIGSYPY